MPRIRQNQESYLRKDFIAAVQIGQGNAGLMQKKELADASGIPYSTLRKRMNDPENLTVAELRKLVSAIPLAPEALLTFVGYNTKAIKAMKEEPA